jgi:uncharacterized protein (TIGR01319 family)
MGSTFTKIVVADLENEKILCSMRTVSTINEDIMIGLKEVLAKAKKETGIVKVNKEDVLACSSAAGGLKMVCIGLVPDLSLKAGSLAALGAGAKLLANYSYELTKGEIKELENIAPDIILLAGGTDGGNKSVVLHNAKLLAKSRLKTVITVACNKVVHEEVSKILRSSGKEVRIAANVMPEIGKLEVDSSREVIRRIFVENIVRAKGLEKTRGIVQEVIMPTPTAVLNAAKLMAEGVAGEQQFGELLIVDVGGATTDVHSGARGDPVDGVVYHNLLPEPFLKRTVEGDLGVRHNLDTLLQFAKEREMLNNQELKMAGLFSNFASLPKNDTEAALDMKFAYISTKIAVERHAGRMETWHGPNGRILVQRGKDLRSLSSVIGTGGPIVFAANPEEVLKGVLFDHMHPDILKPKAPDFYLDDHYILYAIGILATVDSQKALRIAKKYMKKLN